MDVDYWIRLDLLVDENRIRKVKVIWISRNRVKKAYHIDLDELTSIAEKDVRPALDRLVAARTSGDPADHDEVFADIVRAGRRLNDTLFLVKGGDATQQYVNTQIRDEVSRRTDRPVITFIVPARLHIPWALMYDPEADDIKRSSRIDQDRACWALKYRVAVIYDNLAVPEDFDATHHGSTFGTLAAANPTLLAQAEKDLANECAVAGRPFVPLDEKCGGVVTSLGALDDAWRKRGAKIGLLYLFCHANRTALQFSDSLSATNKLDTIHFGRTYKKQLAPPPCLVFLNGCHTAVGSERGGFLEATAGDGFCGFIGAETGVPYLFAHRFGRAFIDHVYQGQPLIDVMDHLRKRHWPLSLLCGLYAYPFLRVEGTTEPANAASCAENFSLLEVGSHRI